MNMPMQIRLSDNVMRSFRVAKLCEDSLAYKNCLEFSPDGKLLLACDESALTLYNCLRPVQLCQVPMQNFEPQLACFTNDSGLVLHNASKLDYVVRLLDLHRNLTVRCFGAHSRDTCALRFRPHGEHEFISAGLDAHLYLWDFRSWTFTHRLKDLHNPLLAYDPSGLVFAVTTETNRIDIHDVRMLSRQPCQRFDYSRTTQAKWKHMEFAPDGKTLLISTDHSWCFTVDAFSGCFQHGYTGYANDDHLAYEACYTPDSQFVMTGADEGRVHIWRAATGAKVGVLRGNNAGPARCLRFSPKQLMFVTSNLLTMFWIADSRVSKDFVWTMDKSVSSKQVELMGLQMPASCNDLEDGEIVETEDEPKRVEKQAIKLPLSVKRPAANPFRGNEVKNAKVAHIDDDTLEEGELVDDDD